MSERYLLKLNLFILVLEIYTILALLYEIEIPGASLFLGHGALKLLFCLLPLSLTFLSKYTEGWTSITIPTLLCSLLIPIAAITPGILKISLGTLAALLAILHLNSVIRFPVYTLIKPTGKFSVGYKSYYNTRDNFKYCVFYPTLNPTNVFPKLIPDPLAWRKYHEISQGKKGNFPPRGLFEIVTHIYTKVSLYAAVNSPIVSKAELKSNINKEKMIPIIFSHGLGASQHNYASIVTQLASKGFFVVSIDHMDEVKTIFQGTMEIAQKYLENRMCEIRRIIDELSNSKGSIRELFGSDLNLDMSRLTVMGHSYGGACAYLSAWEDERVKNVLMFDPWLCPIQQGNLDKQLNCNILLFESENWSDMYPELGINSRNVQVVEAQRDGKGGAVYCKVPESEHNHFSDDPLIVGGLFEYTKVIRCTKQAKRIWLATIEAVDNFFQFVVSKNEGEEDYQRFMNLYHGDSRFPLIKY